MSIKNRIIAASILIALGFWVVAAVADVMFFSGSSFLDELILNPSPHEIYIRSLGTAFIVIPGIIISIIYARQKTIERKLIQNEQSLNEAQVTGRIGSWEFDVEKQTIDWSKEMYILSERDQKLGPYSPEEEVRYYAPQQAKKLRDCATKAIDTGLPVSFEIERSVHTGKTAYYQVNIQPVKDEHGKVFKLSGIIQDITERRQMAAQIANSEVRYRRLFETAQDAILILNGDSGQIIDANPFIKDLLGYSEEELLGKNLWEIGELKDAPVSKISYEELHESGYKRWDNLSLVSRDGRQISVEVIANAYEVDHTRVIQCNIRDMTAANLAVEALKEVNADLKIAQRLTKIGNWKWIIATNKVTWSDALYQINGWDQNLPVPPFAEMGRFYTPESWKRLNEVVTKALNNGEPYEIELDQIRTDGSLIKTFSRGEADYNPDGKIVSLHGTVQDITESKRAEERVRESEERYRTLFESAIEGILIADSETKRNIYANPAICTMLGYSQEELTKMSVADVHPKASLEHAIAEFNAVTRREKKQSTLPCLKKDGTIIYADISATHAVIDGRDCNIGFFTDVTERNMAEETLRLQAQLLDAELDSVYLHDFEGNFIYVNKAAYFTHGYTREELLNMKLSQLDDPESAKLIAPRLKEIFEKGNTTFEVNHLHKNGSKIPLEIHTSLVEVGGKKMIMSVAHDITERQKVQQQLMAQDRLASIGQLVSGVAHEINNPLTGVIGFSDLLLQRDLPREVKDDLKIINDEAQRTAKIVQNLLTFARKQPEGKLQVDINDNMRKVLALRNHEQKVNNIQVNAKLAPNLPQVMGNASQLQQVFFNIVVNAEQAMIGVHGGSGTLTVTTERAGDNVRVSFTDNGPGISPENMRRLFTPFFTTKGVGKGTGLGLSICHGIVTEHRGTIHAESEPGKGATFIIELPIIMPV